MHLIVTVARINHEQILVLRFECRLALVLAIAGASPVHDVPGTVSARLRKAVPFKHQISTTVVAVRLGGLFQVGALVVPLQGDGSQQGNCKNEVLD